MSDSIGYLKFSICRALSLSEASLVTTVVFGIRLRSPQQCISILSASFRIIIFFIVACALVRRTGVKRALYHGAKNLRGAYFGHFPFPRPVRGPFPSGPVPSPLGIPSLLALSIMNTQN